MNNINTFLESNNLTSRHQRDSFDLNPIFVNILTKNELAFIKEYNGSTFENGLFRVFLVEDIFKYNKIISDYFESFRDILFVPFGVDWMGRIFAIGKNSNDNIMYMFDPATGEYFEMEQDLFGFLNEDLVEYRNDLLGEDRFFELYQNDKTPLNIDQCFGFKIFLFLGGEDLNENLEKIDIEVYWELNSQVS